MPGGVRVAVNRLPDGVVDICPEMLRCLKVEAHASIGKRLRRREEFFTVGRRLALPNLPSARTAAACRTAERVSAIRWANWSGLR